MPQTTPSEYRHPSGRGFRPWGCATFWTCRRALRCGRWSLSGLLRSIRDGVALPNPSWRANSGAPWGAARRGALPEDAWQEITVAQGSQGPHSYLFSTWAGWHHHVALCLLGGTFLLSLQQAWGGKDAPGTVRPQGVAAMVEGASTEQRAGQPLSRKTPLRPSSRQDGSTTLNPSCSTRGPRP